MRCASWAAIDSAPCVQPVVARCPTLVDPCSVAAYVSTVSLLAPCIVRSPGRVWDAQAACMRRNISLRGRSSVFQVGGEPVWPQLSLLRATDGSTWSPVDTAVFWPVHGASFALSSVPHVTAQCTVRALTCSCLPPRWLTLLMLPWRLPQRNMVHTDPLHWARTHEPPSSTWSALVDVCKGPVHLTAQGISDGGLAEAGAQMQVALPRMGVCQVVAGGATPWGVPDVEVSWRPPPPVLSAQQHTWRVCKPGDGPAAVELQCGGTAVRLDERAHVHVQHVLRPRWCTCRIQATLLQGVQVKVQTAGATTLGVSIDTLHGKAEASLKARGPLQLPSSRISHLLTSTRR